MITSKQQLLNKCLKGDRLAQKQFYLLFRDKMFVLCLRFSNNRAEAEDLLQEGFVRVFLDLGNYKNKGNLEGWVRKVVLNVCLQYIRKHKNKPITEDLLDHAAIPIPEDDHLILERGKELIYMLQHLPPGYRAVINLYILEGYSHASIAEELGISENTSKSQLSRAKKYLKTLLKERLISSAEKT